MLRTALFVLTLATGVALASDVCFRVASTVTAGSPVQTTGLFCGNESTSCDLEFFARASDTLFLFGASDTVATDLVSTTHRPGQTMGALEQEPATQAPMVCFETSLGCNPATNCKVVVTYDHVLPQAWSRDQIKVFWQLTFTQGAGVALACDQYAAWGGVATLAGGVFGIISPDSTSAYSLNLAPTTTLNDLLEPCQTNCSNGVVDPGEQCDSEQCCSTDTCQFLASDVVCNGFDFGVTCTGASGACPQPITASPSISPSAPASASSSAPPSPSQAPTSSPSKSPSAPPTPSPSPLPVCQSEVCERYYPQ